MIAVAAGGCGGDMINVRGQVTLDGKPLDKGNIAFIPAPDLPSPAAGGDIIAGQYQLPQPIKRGNYTVEIRSMQKTGKRFKGLYGEQDEEVQIIPETYNKKSKLRFTPSDDPQHANFTLTTK